MKKTQLLAPRSNPMPAVCKRGAGKTAGSSGAFRKETSPQPGGGAPGARPSQAVGSSPHGRSDRPAISPGHSPVNRPGTGNRDQVMGRMGGPRALTQGEKTDGAETISRDAAPLPGDCTAILPLYCHVIAGTYRSIREDARHNISPKTHEHERLMDLPGTTWTP